MARPSRFTVEQIVEALRRVENGIPAAEMCRTLGITETTFYRWRKRIGQTASGKDSEVRVLRDENQKLKQIVANLLLEKL